MSKKFIQKIKHIPVPMLPTLLGALTLSNIYSGFGFSYFRHIIMWIATAFLLVYLLKIIVHIDVFKKEYSSTIAASLYPAFVMNMMVLGSYYYDFNNTLGSLIILLAVLIHFIHIILFTIKNVIKERNIDTTMPSWFVTYNGIMVSCVVGAKMIPIQLATVITYYGIAVYFVLLCTLIWRIKNHPVKDSMQHTIAIFVAPASLCIVSYINVIQNAIPLVVYILYACVVLSFIHFIYKLPVFFSYEFSPSFAALTFPMAIATVASIKMASYLGSIGYEVASNIVTQFSGFQVFITSSIIGYVLYNFMKKAIIAHKAN